MKNIKSLLVKRNSLQIRLEKVNKQIQNFKSEIEKYYSLLNNPEQIQVKTKKTRTYKCRSLLDAICEVLPESGDALPKNEIVEKVLALYPDYSSSSVRSAFKTYARVASLDGFNLVMVPVEGRKNNPSFKKIKLVYLWK